MGLFSSLFGGSKKIDYSQMIPDPPKFSLADGSQGQYTGGLQQLIDVFNGRANGTDQFDAISYIYGPQANELRQNYGIDTNPGDIYSQRTGVLPQTLASMNSRGLLDTGTSGIIEGQLRSNLANELARAYGGAKTMQRTDVDNSLSALAQLFPQRFQAQNIQSQVDYDNAMNQYNTLLNRNAATVGQQQSMAQNKANAWQSGLGLALAPFTGGASLFGGGQSAYSGGTGGAGNTGSSGSPYQQNYLRSLFGQNPYTQSNTPGMGGGGVLNYGGKQYQTSQPPIGSNYGANIFSGVNR
jgi:hypothetical protein